MEGSILIVLYHFQSEAIKVLEQAADDGRVAMETADQSLSKREECVAVLQSEIRELQGTSPVLDQVPETPNKNDSNNGTYALRKSTSYLEKFRESVSKLGISADEHEGESDTNDQGIVENEIMHKFQRVRSDSSGVGLDSDLNFSDNESIDIPLRTSVNKCISEVIESPQRKAKDSESHEQSSQLEYTVSDTGKLLHDLPRSPLLNENPHENNNIQHKLCNSMNFKNMINKKLDYEIHKPLNDSRVLQVILTPLKNKLLVKHTKSSMLRLKNSPSKDPTYGRECIRVKSLPRKSLHLEKENFYKSSQIVDDDGKQKRGKRKCSEKENEQHDLNTSKKRKMIPAKKKQMKAKPKRSSLRQYNLRTRR